MRARAEGPLPYECMRLLFQAEQKSTVVPEVTQVVVWVLEKYTVVLLLFGRSVIYKRDALTEELF